MGVREGGMGFRHFGGLNETRPWTKFSYEVVMMESLCDFSFYFFSISRYVFMLKRYT